MFFLAVEWITISIAKATKATIVIIVMPTDAKSVTIALIQQNEEDSQ